MPPNFKRTVQKSLMLETQLNITAYLILIKTFSKLRNKIEKLENLLKSIVIKKSWKLNTKHWRIFMISRTSLWKFSPVEFRLKLTKYYNVIMTTYYVKKGHVFWTLKNIQLFLNIKYTLAWIIRKKTPIKQISIFLNKWQLPIV